MGKTHTLTFTGDVMLARLIDQLYPTHIHDPSSAATANHFRETCLTLSTGTYNPSSPWGTTLPLLRNSEITLINLETAATTSPTPWPGKAFNYRMHPANLAPILRAANVGYVGLANNHTLDFGVEGLLETIRTVERTRIPFAGAGESTEEARRPAVLKSGQEGRGFEVLVYAAADHPREWGDVDGFHLIDYTFETRKRLKELLMSGGARSKPALKVFSVHWGPNYTWEPGEKIRGLAHFLVDECEVDIVHGHSSHHVQGVEVYRGKLIIYGCGDFVDDYVVHDEYRNDLGALWRVNIKEEELGNGKGKLVLDRLEIFPTRIERFRAMLLGVDNEDHEWVRRKVSILSMELGTLVREEIGSEGQIVVDIDQ
ncbi:Capsule synthesis protein CapA [Penicillium sp. IBT 18751x]|nr:Capsule synthesis protein CapA [Penicillium sp. IBT 18751x]